MNRLKISGKSSKKGGLKRSKKIMKKTRKIKKSRKTKKGKKTNKSKSSKKHKRRVKKRLHSMKGGDDTPGHEAAARGDIEGVRNYLGDDGDTSFRIDEQDEMGETMLYIALENRHDDIAEMLLNEYNANIRVSINGYDLIEWTAVQPDLFSDRGFNMIYEKALNTGLIDRKTYHKYYRHME